MMRNYIPEANRGPVSIRILGSIGFSCALLASVFGGTVRQSKHAAGDSVGSHGAKRGALLFSDNFDRAELGPEWIVHFKEVSIKNGVLAVQQVPDLHPAIARHNMELGNTVFDFDIRFASGAKRGLLVVNGTAHVFHVSFLETAEGMEVSLKDYANPNNTVTAKAPKSAAGKWLAVTLVLVDDRLEAVIDGQSIVALKSPGLAAKKTLFQLNGVGQHMEYDNVEIWNVATPIP